MIFLPVLLFGVLLLLLLRTNKIFAFFRRGKGGKEEDQEERMFLLGAAVRRTKGVGGFTVARAEGVNTIARPQKEGKKNFVRGALSFFFLSRGCFEVFACVLSCILPHKLIIARRS